MSGIHANIAVCIPHCGRPVLIEWSFALCTQNWPMGTNIAWLSVKGQDVAAQRNELVSLALDKFSAKYIWFIDDDTAPPAFAARLLIRALEDNPRAAAAAGIYCTKSPHPEPLVSRRLDDGMSTDWGVGEIFECEGIATGCMMIRASALASVPLPLFLETDDDCLDYHRDPRAVFQRKETEDIYFCRKLREAGHTILAHGGVLPLHFDHLTGAAYALPEDSWPARHPFAPKEPVGA